MNTAALEAAADLAPSGVTLERYEGIADLPHFNPDLDHERPPEAVVAWRRAVEEADGLLVSSPEYAHGVPGALKNALDWLVSFPPFVGKPVGMVNARPEATHAFASLQETLRVMSAQLVDGAVVSLPLKTNALDARDLKAAPEVASLLVSAVEALASASRR